ncbi:MAG: serine/threonine-protein kinase [Isosphaeraceae bacterium]
MPGVISVGDWIGNRFQVFDVHEGGMSRVYVANDDQGEPGRKVVALKTLREELLRSRTRIRRFAAECRIWVQLGDHPNIVRAYSVEIIDGRPYVVVELVKGGDLYRWIGTPRLDLPRILRLGYQFCAGLEHALRQGLHCHRDIKPGNLLVTEDGTLKITDFGLARACEEMVAVRPELPDGSIPLSEPTVHHAIVWTDPRDLASQGAGLSARDGRNGGLMTAGRTATTTSRPQSTKVANGHTPTTVAKETSDYELSQEPFDPRITRSGARLGTGAYMAPEQFLDPKTVDVRADIYGFGVVLYEMITGELPFKGKSAEALAHQHSTQPARSVVPSIASRYAKLAKPVDAIVQRCLKKDLDQRFRSVAELRHALKAIIAQLPHR